MVHKGKDIGVHNEEWEVGVVADEGLLDSGGPEHDANYMQ